MTIEQNHKINDFFVQTFNQILAWEELTLKNVGVDDLSVRELHVIEAVSNLEKVSGNTMANTAGYLSISPGSLTTSVNVLVKKGYIERYQTPQDRRVIYLRLTSKGEDVNKIHSDFHEKMISGIAENLDKNELELLTTTLDKLSEFFKENVSGYRT